MNPSSFKLSIKAGPFVSFLDFVGLNNCHHSLTFEVSEGITWLLANTFLLFSFIQFIKFSNVYNKFSKIYK